MPNTNIANQQNNVFSVLTYNIRYDAEKDTENPWKIRKGEIVDLLRFYQPAIFGVQEGLFHQLETLGSLLPEYAYVGVGRDDGKRKGEYTAIFYNKSIFEILEYDTFWLSDTTDSPSLGWDASYPRICTWAAVKEKLSNSIFYVFNTHFDHMGKNARLNSAALILKKAKEIAKQNPLIIIGDFNAEPDSEEYQVLTAGVFRDAFHVTSTPHFGPDATFNGFDFFTVPTRRIDYVLLSDHFRVQKHAILNNHYLLKYPSDHFPVIAEIRY